MSYLRNKTISTEIAATAGAFAWLARAKAISAIEGGGVELTLHKLGAPEELIARIKAATSASSTSSAAELAGTGTIVATFIDRLAESSVFARMVAESALQRVPLNSRLIAFGADIPADVVDEGRPIPVSEMELVGQSIEGFKVASMVVATSELWRDVSGAGQAFINRKLNDAVAKAADTAFFDRLTVSGTTTLTAYANDGEDIRAGLRSLLDIVHVGASARLFWAVSPGASNALATLPPGLPELNPMTGELIGLPAIITSGLSGRRLALVDARAAVGLIDRVHIEASGSGAFEMKTDPTNDTVTPTATTMVSMFQTGSVAVRCLMYLAIEALRDDPLAYLELEDPTSGV